MARGTETLPLSPAHGLNSGGVQKGFLFRDDTRVWSRRVHSTPRGPQPSASPEGSRMMSWETEAVGLSAAHPRVWRHRKQVRGQGFPGTPQGH